MKLMWIAVVVLFCGCTVIHPFTGRMLQQAPAILMEQRGYVRSSVSGMVGAPDPSRPGFVLEALTEEQSAQQVYGWKYTVADAVEKSLDGAVVVGGVLWGASELKASGGGDTTINAGRDVIQLDQSEYRPLPAPTPTPTPEQ